MKSLELQNLRCFEKVEAPLAPLTFLVGENSTGKSTFLAALKLGWDLLHRTMHPAFNEDPYYLGAFQDIVSFGGARRGFRLGGVLEMPSRPLRKRTKRQELKRPMHVLEFSGHFTAKGAEPFLADATLKGQGYSLHLAPAPVRRQSPWQMWRAVIMSREPRFQKTVRVGVPDDQSSGGMGGGLLVAAMRALYTAEQGSRGNARGIEQIEEVLASFGGFSRKRGHEFSVRGFAPVRTRPQRTYDPGREAPRSTGEHVPSLLARLRATDQERWRDLVAAVKRFGTASGMFDSIGLKQFGRATVDPFQLQVRVSGKPVNLMDVGYGVSQILPVLVECLGSHANETFLLQQPEVHLHPRAQAELGSLFGRLAATGKSRFVIETHSQYMLDRVRLDIRKRRRMMVSPDDVRVLFFERKGSHATIHAMRLDENANMIGCPPGYGRFFLEEQRGLLE